MREGRSVANQWLRPDEAERCVPPLAFHVTVRVCGCQTLSRFVAFRMVMRPGATRKDGVRRGLGPRRSLLGGDAEGVDRRVDLHSGERGLGRNEVWHCDSVVAGGESVVEEQERIALRVRWHERGLPPDGHLDAGLAGEGQLDRPLVGAKVGARTSSWWSRANAPCT